MDRPSDGRRGRRALVMAFVAAAVLLTAAWWGVSAYQRAQVAVWFDHRPVECRDGAPEVIEHALGLDPVFVTAVDASPGLDCWLRVRVANSGPLGVRLRELAMPYHGPGTGGGVRATRLSPLEVEPEPGDPHGPGALDARFRLDHPLGGGEELVFRLHLEHAPRGCMAREGYTWVQDAPAISVSALGWPGHRAPTGIPFVQRGTEHSTCDPEPSR